MSSSDAIAPERRFLRAFVGAIVALAAAMLFMCWLVDPTGLLHERGLSPAICTPGIRTSDDRHVKPLLTAALQPDEVLIGSSRALHGFTADDFGGRRVANLAVSGATLAEVDLLARHAASAGQMRRIWIGLDFSPFVTEDGLREPLTFPSAGMDDRWVAIRYGLLDRRALKAALRSILVERGCTEPVFTPDGFLARSQSLAHAGQRRDQSTLATITRNFDAARRDRPLLYHERLRRLDRLLAHLRERRVAVVVYLGPVSSAYRSALSGSGLDQQFQRWPADVNQLVRRHGGSFVSAHENEFLAPIRDQACGRTASIDCLFLGVIHFRPEVGAAIVRTALQPERSRQD